MFNDYRQMISKSKTSSKSMAGQRLSHHYLACSQSFPVTVTQWHYNTHMFPVYDIAIQTITTSSRCTRHYTSFLSGRTHNWPGGYGRILPYVMLRNAKFRICNHLYPCNVSFKFYYTICKSV